MPHKFALAVAGLFPVAAGTWAAPPDPETPAAQAAGAQPVPQVQVTAQRLRSARIELSPSVGTTVYTVTTRMVDALAHGENTPFDEVLQHLPGVSQDSKASGSLHVRDEHGNVQYRINGVQLPEGLSGFGQSIDTRLVDQVTFMTGTLPAQFGLRTAAVIDIQTKEGGEPGGRVGLQLGSHNYIEPSAEFFGSSGDFNYYVSAGYLKNFLGIENPQPTRDALHDKTWQAKTFGSLSYFLDQDTRLGLMFGTYNGRFEIPNNPGQEPQFSLAGVSDAAAGTSTIASSDLDERQREVNRFLVLSYQRTMGELSFQASYFHQYSELHYMPDPIGDLVFTGVASDTLRSNSANGTQVDLSYKLNPSHTVRGGLAYARQGTHSGNTVSVFPTGPNGAQASDIPFTIVDNSGKLGTLTSLYLQDEWRVSAELTVNYGLRYDQVAAFIHEQQWSPRVNVAYKLSPATALHAGYSRYFTPPPQELASQESINLFAHTTNAPEIPFSDPVKAERTSYYDIGITHQLSPTLTVTADAYYRDIRDMLDEGQFGRALILTPFNYARGKAKGLEFSAIYSGKIWGAYLNAALAKAQGKNINSGQALFNPDELAYIANHFIYVDHDQRWTWSGGGNFRFGDSQLSMDFLFGSGLRRTPEGAPPNSDALPSYLTINAALTHSWPHTLLGKIEGRVALINVFDRTYLLRDGSGVGVGAPQYGQRRGLYVGLSSSF
ncbi:TonB-dependent receptor [Massilia horti]|uniref:TonB-dependent receptor n=1 Tax=Massilia horti TaxID=2562153 RepID=A0A4Y9T5S4_9BURK|nr:TonB-dependent receptor [Massilia horti]TFW33876.1 TonB-dependent receptor [Massilia horti]